MLVDNPIQHNFSASYNSSSLDEFLNLELFGGSSNPTAGSSGSSPRSSPSNSFTGLPPTPPEPFSINDISLSPSPFFSIAQDDDMSKLNSFVPPAATTAGYDFLASYSQLAQMSSPESSGSGTFSSSGDSPVSIDPQLMHTPAGEKPASEFDEEEEGDDDDLAIDNDDLQSIPEDHVLPQMKVGGKGKANRKGTVRDGGIMKRAPSVEKKENKQPAMLSTTSSDPDDWRPTPEEYKKMSSKEKRQLRNKISARNFRVRRKEYITTLEGDIADRDRLIDAIRTELGSMKSENVALRQEIDALKRALLDGRGRSDTPVLPPPGPLPPVSAAVRASASSPSPAPAPPRSPLLTPNTQKDLPTSPRLNARNAFWGGAAGMGSFGSITPVHTTLVPEWGSILSGKAAQGRKSPALQENINPSLNPSVHGSASALQSLLSGRTEEKQKEHSLTMPMGGFDMFTDTNPFTLKSLDAYRMQLWGRMAEQQASQRQSQSQGQQPGATPSGLASNLRPHFFNKSPTLSALLSGKSLSSSASSASSRLLNPYPTPPSSPPLGSSASANTHKDKADAPTAQQAMLASMASQTLFSKLGGAFWDAFARPSGNLGPNGHVKHEWDADKVRRVMEGTAVVRVVDVEPQPQPAVRTSPTLAAQKQDECTRCKAAVTDLLTESMASLSLGRK
ncbi:hypothetical protein L226DRAFT_524595 [Lentinus tigrinus ALCF2SS1-7]|uniref:BZIP domain-containing protein n=1 Tax=Lentinus tigrinus ALCF2SS1-6 TaxID=1328759 RepID=A0A5C2RWI2_9APHY|nr:hypothetical protein L227DRAFT_588448 [Lentinus tigrinus ALCF2SS1-6]RPD72540.1 hypothetical protein L226DRAFT_524595 [Lentinus tigrinus ALCF2SS1-7]